MKKSATACLGALATIMLFGSCNSNEEIYDDTKYSSTAVYSFAFSEDKKVMEHLDTVFFSIDLVNARIFNADSLPMGAPVNKLVPKVVMVEGASAIQFTVHRANGSDTTYNYTANTTDSIDFSHGPVDMRIVSLDGLSERTYSIHVNVHTLKADSLTWDREALRTLPSAFNVPTRQHTTATAHATYCLTEAGGNYSLAVSQDLFGDEWTTSTPSLPAGAIIDSFTGADNALYILAADGATDGSAALWRSTDGAATWQPLDVRMNHIYGSLGEHVYGAYCSDGTWCTVSSGTSALMPLPAGVPVAQTSCPARFTFPLAEGEQMLVVGGVDADGKIAKSAWAFDGDSWARVSRYSLSWAARRMTLVSFVSYQLKSNLIPQEFPTMLAFGGIDDKGAISQKVYMSRDYGMNWSEAPANLQLADYLTPVYGAQAIVADATLHGRAIRPIDQWECPFIYVFGGTTTAGTLSNTLWRGTINRLLFKPLQ